jgi:hypothetical protein
MVYSAQAKQVLKNPNFAFTAPEARSKRAGAENRCGWDAFF